MDDMYGLHLTPADYAEKVLMWPENLMIPAEYLLSPGDGHRFPVFGSDNLFSAASASATAEAASITPVIQRGGGGDDDAASNAIKARIASHPWYPKLLEAYIDCRKIGAPPEISCLLDEIRRENGVSRREATSTCLGADPELDEFMETYCDVLVKYKSNLSTPFDEATAFLSKMEIQLGNLCEDDEVAASSDEEVSGEEQERELKSEEREIKDELLRKYGSHLGRLKQQFSKKKKKGKLPKEARQLLLEWWNLHYRWPYPTESDKMSLAESTGLDHKQINNWFINQRKRHWKPSENMQLALMNEISGPFFTDN